MLYLKPRLLISQVDNDLHHNCMVLYYRMVIEKWTGFLFNFGKIYYVLERSVYENTNE